MTTHASFPKTTVPEMTVPPKNGARDLLAKLYREIGISAVAAALESSAAPKQPKPAREADFPAFLRDDRAA